MTTGTIASVDPRTLTIALNVRTDTKLDSGFVDSIRELGILQPPMVTPNGDGGYDVVLGQRRTLAAVEAGLATIPVYVVDGSEADAARVIDQLTENDQRQQLSEAERIGGYKQLSLFGISPADIAKRTGAPRVRVETALTVADDERALSALVEHELTLDEAAYLVEFTDDPAAVKELTKAAAEGRLAHAVGDLRKKRDLAQLQTRLRDELVEEGVILMLPSTNNYGGKQDDDPEGLARLDRFGKPGTPTEPLEVADVPAGHLAGRVVTDYMSVDGAYVRTAAKQYFVLHAEEVGIPALEHERQVVELTPEQQAERDARIAQEQKNAEAAAARASAAEVRWEWILEMLQRKQLPDDATAFIAALGVLLPPKHDEVSLAVFGLGSEGKVASVAEVLAFLDAEPNRAAHFLLAVHLRGAELSVQPNVAWRAPNLDVAVIYLPRLMAWGYGLSEAEQELLERAEAAAAEPDEDDEDEYDDEEGDEEE